MYLVTNSQMKAIEQRAINSGVPSLLLMENAAMSLTRHIIKDGFKSVLVFCGRGNNGGDGLACARQLYAEGLNVTIIYVGMPQGASEDNKINLNAARVLDIPIIYFDRDIEALNDMKPYLDSCDLIVDALVGTGLASALREPLSSITDIINMSGKAVYSADCPTGISTDTGEDFGKAVYADKTVTFHLPKVGLMLYPACEHTGELAVGSISLPQSSKTNMRVLSHNEAELLMPKRKSHSDKSAYGRVYAFVGCNSMTGAALMSLKSAYRTGAGLVYGYLTPDCAAVVRNSLPEAVITCSSDTDGYLNEQAADIDLSGASVVLTGCGLGNNGITHDFLAGLLKNITSPLVIDADGLNILSSDNSLLTSLPANTVITPHPKEMSRLTGLSVNKIVSDPINTALSFAKKYNVITVLKDAHTIIASPKGEITINTAGTPAMSKGGSGDCLAGIIAALIAQGLDIYNAASLGCYISGKAGRLAEDKTSSYGMLATDLIDCIPKVFNRI